MLLLAVEEKWQEKLKQELIKAGFSACIWYECEGDEEVVIVPSDMHIDEGFLVQMEEVE